MADSARVLVAGAGIWGCTVARRLAEAGRRVSVLERRQVVGGNVRCETDPETGIEVHAYGSHIFHTHDPEVWAWVRRFTEFNGYQHKVLARVGGRTYFLPLGLPLISKFFGVELAPGDVDGFLGAPGSGRRQAIFDAFFRGYTSKQWGCDPGAVDPSVIRRVPVRSSYDVNYFNDLWQGIPSEGYNRFFERLLDHPNIEVTCGVDFTLADCRAATCPVYYSGPLDRLFGYCHGELPWRSLRFELECLPCRDFQGTAVVNYPEPTVPYTRIHEFKHYHPERREVMEQPRTLVMREFPQAWRRGEEPYYPIKSRESDLILAKYVQETQAFPQLIVGGRLGGYRYLDMDQAVADALARTKK